MKELIDNLELGLKTNKQGLKSLKDRLKNADPISQAIIIALELNNVVLKENLSEMRKMESCNCEN